MKTWRLIVWLVGIVGVLVVSAALFTSKTFRVEVFVPAPQKAVWSVLTDTSRYREWNPVFIQVDGEFQEGAEIRNTVLDPDGNELAMTSTVDKLVPEREIRQYGGVPGIITFDHTWRLEPEEGGTKVIQHEIDRGLGLWFWDSSWIEPSYTKASEALKERVLELAEERARQ